MEIQTVQAGTIRIVGLTGRFDEMAAPEVDAALHGVLQEHSLPHIVVDLAGVEYISSSALRVLMMLSRAVNRSNGELALCGLSPFVAEVFEIGNFNSLFQVYSGRDAAVYALAQKAG